METSTTRHPEALDLRPMRGCRIIGIDGDHGVGKTTELAHEIRAGLGGTIVSVDDFLSGSGEPYLSQIDYPRLAWAVEEASAPVILEGSLLLDVLDRLRIKTDFLIFAQNEHVGITMYGTDPEIEDYYRRRSPHRLAQLTVTKRIVYNMAQRSVE